MSRNKVANKARVLLLDVETFPNEGYSWGKWQQDIIDFTKHWYILSIGYQWWREQGGVKVITLPMLPGYKSGGGNEARLIEVVHKLFDHADFVISHNAKKFDVRRIFTRMVQLGMKPPSTFRVIDTLTEARKFSFNSSKLDDIGRDTGLGRKMHHIGFPMWEGCHQGDPKSWAAMEKYNRRDVVLLRKWFNRLVPWLGYLSSKGTPYVKPKKVFA